MDQIQVGAELAAKLAGLSPEDLTARFQGENGEPLPAEKQGEVFAELVNQRRLERERQVGEDKFKQGVKEKGRTIEQALNPLFQRFQVEADRAEDAIQQLAEKLTDKPGTPDLSTLTADQLEQLPQYKTALEQRDNLRKKLEETQRQFDQFRTEQQTRELRSNLGREIRRIFDQKKANIGSSTLDDAAEFFLNSLNLSQFKIDGGKVVPLTPDGSPLMDAYGDPVTLDSFVEQRWSFGFNVADPGKAGGNPPGGKAGGSVKHAYTNDADWRAAIEKENDRDKKTELLKGRAAWLRSQLER